MENTTPIWSTAMLRQGDSRAFEALYRHFYRGLCAFASQYVPLSEAEEVVQDTMMWLWEHRSELDEELSIKTLLFTIVKHKALNLVTHEEIRRRVHEDIVEKYRDRFDDPDLYLDHELFALYRKALGKLPADFRQAFELNRIHHMTHREIAERLNVSTQTVNYRICQALKLLRIELKDYLPLLLLLLSLKNPALWQEHQTAQAILPPPPAKDSPASPSALPTSCFRMN